MLRFYRQVNRAIVLAFVFFVIPSTLKIDNAHACSYKGDLKYWRTFEKVVNIPRIKKAGNKILIGVIGDGIYPHKDLQGKLHQGHNYIGKLNYSKNETCIAGVIARIAPDAEFIDYTVLGDTRVGNSSDMANAIKRATDDGVQVINLSLGHLNHSEKIAEAVQYAHEKEVIVIASAGSNGRKGHGSIEFPAALPNVIAVGSDRVSLLSSANMGIDFESGQGPGYLGLVNKPDLVAPGTLIPTLCPYGGKEYTLVSGVGMATAFVSGVVALLRQRHPSIKLCEIAAALCNHATPLIDHLGQIYPINTQGSGLLNVQQTLQGQTAIFPHNLMFEGKEKLTLELKIKNNSNAHKTFQITVSQENYHKGIFIQTPSYITVNPNSEATIELSAKVELEDFKKEIQKPKQFLSGRIYFTCEEEKLNIPYSVQLS